MRRGNFKLCALLLAHRANPNSSIIFEEDNTDPVKTALPLEVATRNQNETLCCLLLRARANATVGLVRAKLLESKADPNGDDKARPVFNAGMAGRWDLCKLLLQYGAKPHHALAPAVRFGNINFCEHLLNAKADANALAKMDPSDEDNEVLPMLSLALQRDHSKVCKLILKHGASPMPFSNSIRSQVNAAVCLVNNHAGCFCGFGVVPFCWRRARS